MKNMIRLTDFVAEDIGLAQCYPPGYEMDEIEVYHDMETAVREKDIICTDSLPASVLLSFLKVVIKCSVR